MAMTFGVTKVRRRPFLGKDVTINEAAVHLLIDTNIKGLPANYIYSKLYDHGKVLDSDATSYLSYFDLSDYGNPGFSKQQQSSQSQKCRNIPSNVINQSI